MTDRRALIVVSDVYEHEGLRGLSAPSRDADALRSILADPFVGRFEVRVVRNQPSHVIRREVADFFAECRPDDLLLLHFSCHGLKNASGELFLASADTLPTRLTATAVSAQSINQEMVESRARRIVVFLDCCYGGAFPRGLIARAGDGISVEDSFPIARLAGERTDESRGRVVITASSATEYAFEGDSLIEAGRPMPSVFTSALVHGLTTGQADTGLDGFIDLDELYGYVHARVAAATNGRQNPGRWGAAQGKMIIAWVSRIEGIKAENIPELEIRVRDPLKEARIGVVKELRRIILDEDIPRAAGALELLRQLTTDDSNEVSAAAMATLHEAQLRVMPAEIDAGEVRPGEPPRIHTVRLAGSPLARLFQATSTSRWLRVEQSEPLGALDAWIRATVDPVLLAESRGKHSGLISVVNKIGELRIPVTARAGGSVTTRSMGGALSRVGWTRDARVLPVSGATVVVAASATAVQMIHYSSLLGAGYLLLRSAVLVAALVLIGGSGQRRTAGCGLAAATATYFLADAASSVHAASNVQGGATTRAWLEFLAVTAFICLLAIRLWPLPDLPRSRPNLVSPTQRPHAWVALAAAASQLILLFVEAFPDAYYSTYSTIIDCAGMPAALLAVVPVAGLCAVTVLTDTVTTHHRTFVTATLLAYCGPELYFLLGSLLVSPQFSYFGDNVWARNVSAVWFVLAQGAATAVLAAATLLFLWKPSPNVRPTSMTPLAR